MLSAHGGMIPPVTPKPKAALGEISRLGGNPQLYFSFDFQLYQSKSGFQLLQWMSLYKTTLRNAATLYSMAILVALQRETHPSHPLGLDGR